MLYPIKKLCVNFWLLLVIFPDLNFKSNNKRNATNSVNALINAKYFRSIRVTIKPPNKGVIRTDDDCIVCLIDTTFSK